MTETRTQYTNDKTTRHPGVLFAISYGTPDLMTTPSQCSPGILYCVPPLCSLVSRGTCTIWEGLWLPRLFLNGTAATCGPLVDKESHLAAIQRKNGLHLSCQFDLKPIKITTKLIKIDAGNRRRPKMISELSHSGPEWKAHCKYHMFWSVLSQLLKLLWGGSL
jgi:hypothetical protein